MLMCAEHGREVDAPDTGEANFPIDRLRIMKQTHEAKVSDAVTAAIEQELSGVQTATGSIDTTLRASAAATTAEGLLEALQVSDEHGAGRIIAGLDQARSQLRRLSQPALDLLSQLLELWVQQCRDDSTGRCDFGHTFGPNPQMPCRHVDNRIMRGKQSAVDLAMSELMTREIIKTWADEYEGVVYYVFTSSLWQMGAMRYTFWPAVAEFLYDGHGVGVQDWVRGLDFSIFDRPAADDRDVPWR